MAAAFRAYYHCDPWDLVHEGIDEALNRLQETIAIDGLSVTAVGGSAHVFRQRAGQGPRTFRSGAAAHFQPQMRCYASSRLRPPTAEWIKASNPLEKIAVACNKRKLRLRVRVMACDHAGLAERYAFAVCKDAYGDPSPTRLCPGNPDVRAYVAGLIEDLSSHYPLDGIDLQDADFGAPQQFHGGRLLPGELSAWRRTVLCFCESCRQTADDAGIAIERLQAAIAAPARSAEARVPDDESLQALDEHRAALVSQLVAAARKRGTCEMGLRLTDLDPQRGIIPGDLGDYIDLWTPLEPPVSGQPHEGRRHALLLPIREPASVAAVFDVGAHVPWPEGSAGLVREMIHAVHAGRRVVMIESLGQTPDERFDWVRQAVRFARREAGE